MRIPPVNQVIVEAVGKVRLQRGALAELAGSLGVSRNAPTTWITGQVTPEPKYWSAIEQLLELADGTLRRAAADFFDPDYPKVRRRVAALERRIQRQAQQAAGQTGGVLEPEPAGQPGPRRTTPR